MLVIKIEYYNIQKPDKPKTKNDKQQRDKQDKKKLLHSKRRSEKILSIPETGFYSNDKVSFKLKFLLLSRLQ